MSYDPFVFINDLAVALPDRDGFFADNQGEASAATDDRGSAQAIVSPASSCTTDAASAQGSPTTAEEMSTAAGDTCTADGAAAAAAQGSTGPGVELDPGHVTLPSFGEQLSPEAASLLGKHVPSNTKRASETALRAFCRF